MLQKSWGYGGSFSLVAFKIYRVKQLNSGMQYVDLINLGFKWIVDIYFTQVQFKHINLSSLSLNMVNLAFWVFLFLRLVSNNNYIMFLLFAILHHFILLFQILIVLYTPFEKPIFVAELWFWLSPLCLVPKNESESFTKIFII